MDDMMGGGQDERKDRGKVAKWKTLERGWLDVLTKDETGFLKVNEETKKKW